MKSIYNKLKNLSPEQRLAFKKRLQNKGKIDATTIEKAVRPTEIPLSFSQERLWFTDQLQGSTNYHMPMVLRVTGQLDIDLLTNVVKRILTRHESLRTVFKEKNGVGYQSIQEADDFAIDVLPFNKGEQKADIENRITAAIKKPFDLSNDYMIRLAVMPINQQEQMLVVVMHHIASDGWSMPVFVKEVLALYRAALNNETITLPNLPIQYVDYALWQRDYLSDELIERKLTYWKDNLSDLEPLELPTDFTRPAVQSTEGSRFEFQINTETTQALKEFSQAKGYTLFMTLLSIYKVLLYRWSGQKDICVGIPVANRKQREIEGLIGFFVNSLPIRTMLNGTDKFDDLLENIKTTTSNAFDNQELPLEKIVDSLVGVRERSRSPLFQVMFNFENEQEVSEVDLGTVKFTPLEPRVTTSKFDIVFNVREKDGALVVGVEYCTALFKEESIRWMSSHFNELATAIVQDSNEQIGSYSMLTNEEEVQLLETFNNTEASYPKNKTIVDLFETQVKETPDKIAVVFEEKTFTYAELNKKSNQLAHYLINQGVTNETFVAICLDRSLEMIVGLLGILKAGGVYVPIDPEYPQDRIDYMVNDSQTDFIICTKPYVDLFDQSKNIIAIDEDWDTIISLPVSNPAIDIDPNNLMYIIYTSGSTGKPKGVLIEHLNVVRLFKTEKQLFDFNSDDVWTFFHSFCFDFSVWEMYGALLFGGKLVIVSKSTAKDSTAFCNVLEKEGVTVLNQTPSAFYVLQDTFLSEKRNASLRYIIFGGSALQPNYLREWKSNFPNCKLINMYGITETTVHVTYKEIEEEEIENGISNIGKAIPTLKCYILDENKSLQPIGVTGEIYVEGAGLARGYLNRETLTKERFIANPIDPTKGPLYKTGDLARWLHNGDLEYQGRIDDQVKIRGYRIELGEIEHVLSTMDNVLQCVVLAQSDGTGNKQLVAYVVPEGNFDTKSTRVSLEDKLPSYMIPQFFVELERFPLTVNGKVNKKKLPKPDLTKLVENDYVAAQTRVQKDLAVVWSEILGLEKIGIHDNFFEVGGDSIKAIQLVSRAKQSGLYFKVKDIFSYQTIAKISEHLQQSKEILVEEGELKGGLGLLPIQHLFFESNYSNFNHFNQSVLLEIDKTVSSETLLKAINLLSQQHDALRLTYHVIDGQAPIQYYGDSQAILEQAFVKNQGDITKVCTKTQSNLDITTGEVVKFVLINTPKEQENNRFFIVAHHLVIDGVSWRIMLEDLQEIVLNLEKNKEPVLKSKTTSYRQWQEKLEAYSNSETLQSETNYWSDVLRSSQSIKQDKAYIGNTSYGETAFYTNALNHEDTRSLLKEIHHAYGTKINDVLLSALAMTLCKWLDKKEVVIGLEGHGREELFDDVDLSNTIGWFTSIYPVRLSLTDQSMELSSLLMNTKEMLRNVPNKGIGYGILRYLLNTQENEETINTRFDEIVFNYLGSFDTTLPEGTLFGFASEEKGPDVALTNINPNKIAINSLITKGELVLTWSYDTNRFDDATISLLADEYVENLKRISEHCKEIKTPVKTPSDFGLPALIDSTRLQAFMTDASHQSVEDIYPLSPLQEGLLFHGLYSDSDAYVVQFSLDFIDGLDVDIFKQCWSYLFEQHTILRTSFNSEYFDIPVQCVHKQVEVPVDVIDFKNLKGEQLDDELSVFLEENKSIAFDFSTAPLLRFVIIQLPNNKVKLVLRSHHILWDGWSFSSLMNSFLTCYTAIANGQPIPTIQKDNYGDLVRSIAQKNNVKSASFWKEYLSDVTSPSFLPFVKEETSRNKLFGNTTDSLVIEKDLAKDIFKFAKKHHLTVNSIIQGVWAYLLSKYSNQETVMFGVTISGRSAAIERIEDRVGLYINTIPLCTQIEQERSLVDWLSDLQTNHTTGREEYGHLALSDIQAFTKIQGWLFDTLIVFENYPIDESTLQSIDTLSIENIDIEEYTNYVLSLLVSETGDDLKIKFIYNDQLLEQQTVIDIQQHIVVLLKSLISRNVERVGELNYIGAEERCQLLGEFNTTSLEYPKEETVLDTFQKQFEARPNNIAVEYNNKSISYKELEEQTNQLASYLMLNGVEKGSIVPICLERSSDMVIAILAILKTGAAYLPIDPTCPKERFQFILDDVEAQLILSQSSFKTVVADLDRTLNTIYLDDAKETIDVQPSFDLQTEVEPNDLAYLIYTSGTTGKPKGVMVAHHSLNALLATMENNYPLSTADKLMLKTNYTFDVSVYELFGWIKPGASLVVLPPELEKDTVEFVAFIEEKEITHIALVPSLFSVMLGYLELQLNSELLRNVKYLMLAGEALPLELVNRYRQLKLEGTLANIYGPTEATIYSSHYKFNFENGDYTSVPIGKPLDNVELYILDDALSLVPVGVIGELFIAGDLLSKGYLNRPELNKQKFLPNPFYQSGDAQMYRTGDLVKWMPDGNIAFVGRKDHQVKIRGYRIELGDIEAKLGEVEGVQQGVVLAKGTSDGDKRLVAYVIPEEGFDKETTIVKMKEKLPSYMVPQLYVELETFPLNPSGKIDRKALPEPDDSAFVKSAYVAAETETAKALVTIWQDILDVKKVSLQDNFFALGGHSLLAIRLINNIKATFGQKLNVKDIFVHPTLEELANYIDDVQASKVTTIEIKERPEFIPLSLNQERLWFIDQMGDSTQYHIPLVVEVKGALNVEAMQYAFNQVIARHEILRTNILTKDDKPYQRINEKTNFTISQFKVENNPIRVNQIVKEEIHKPFDLKKDYMLRVSLIKLADAEAVFVLVLHHIAGDGWSMPILLNELNQFYNAYHQNETLELKPLAIQYADYAIWQQEFFDETKQEQKVEYWEKQLEGCTPLNLPTDFVRPPIQSTKGNEYTFTIDKEVTSQLNQISNYKGTTLFVTLLAAYKVFLYKYSGQKDITVGTPVVNREQADIDQLIGFFANTVVIRSLLDGTLPFDELLDNLKATTIEAFQHQDAPFHRIVERVDKYRDQSRTPLFQTMFELQYDDTFNDLSFGEASMSSIMHQQDRAQFDLMFSVFEVEDTLKVKVQYCTDLFMFSTIQRMTENFKVLLASLSQNAKAKIADLAIITKAESNQLLTEFNGPKVNYSQDVTYLDLFEEQVKNRPDAVAYVAGDEMITYSDLDKRSNQIARYLEGRNIQKEDLVPICMDRGIDMMVAIIGVLKSGGAFVQIDTTYPKSRAAYIVENVAATVVLTTMEHQLLFENFSGAIIAVDRVKSMLNDISSEPIEKKISNSNLAYVIYTSGSTGMPKGVLLNHGGMLNHMYGMIDALKMNVSSHMAQTASVSFDISVWQMLTLPIIGGKTTIYSKADILQPEEFLSKITEDKISVLELVPSYIETLLDIYALDRKPETFSKLKYLLVTGEAVKKKLIERFFNEFPNLILVNAYGPSEASDDITLHLMDKAPHGDTVPIGKPLQNVNIYIVDTFGKICPIGVQGELWVSGINVARGYLNDPEKTASAFCNDPFSAQGQRLYKTGDIAKWLPDGTIEFIDRKDYQVKIRGHRIELGEIENQLMETNKVKQAVVLAQVNDTGDKELVAYLVPQNNTEKGVVKEMLKEKLPEFMIPARFHFLDELPLTKNGKIDKKALLEFKEAKEEKELAIAPRNATEEKLVQIFKEVLARKEDVGIHDNFFAIGGQSLKAVMLVSRIKNELGISIQIKDVFATPTIASLSEKFNLTDQPQEEIPIEKVENASSYEVSHAQKRIWISEQFNKSEGSYNMPDTFLFEGTLDVEALRETVKELCKRHESLRTVFDYQNGEVTQRVMELDQSSFQLDVIDCEGLTSGELNERISKVIWQPLNLESGPLFKIEVMKLAEKEYLLVFVIHHIIADGWSTDIIFKELTLLYGALTKNESNPLQPLELQYRDFSSWQNKMLSEGKYEQQEKYWLNVFKKQTTTLALPVENVDENIRSSKSKHIVYKIPKLYADAMRSIAAQKEVSLYMLMLAVVKYGLYKITNQTDITIGTPVAGRRQKSLENLVGCFINTLALRTVFSKDMLFDELLNVVKGNVLEAFENQDYPFDLLVNKLPRDKEKSKLFNVGFTWHNTVGYNADKAIEEQAYTIKPYGYEVERVKADLWIFGSENDENEIELSIAYNDSLFKEETIIKVKELIENIITNISSLLMEKIGDNKITFKYKRIPKSVNKRAALRKKNLEKFFIKK